MLPYFSQLMALPYALKFEIYRENKMAIVAFHSQAAGEIFMFRETAEKIFKVIGKPLGLRGVLTPEEMPPALTALKTAIEQEKSLLKGVREREDKDFREGKDLDREKRSPFEQPVYFGQRANPFIELLERSLKEGKPVTWGV